MKKNSTSEVYKSLLNSDSSDLHEILTAFLESGDGIYIADKKGTIKYVNSAYEKMSGYKKEELIGQPSPLRRSGAESQKTYRKAWDQVQSGKIFRDEFFNRHKNGTLYYESTTIVPVKDEKGKVIGFVSNGRDVTEHFYQEKKFLLFGKLSSSVLSTELRNPILHIKSAAVRLRDFAAKHNELKALKDLNAVYATCGQMQHTLDALQEFFSPPLDAKPSIEIIDAINWALKLVEPEFAERKIVFKVKCQSGLPRVMLHKKLWEFVFEELLHHFGAMALSSKEKTPAVSVTLRLHGADIVVDVEGGNGSPFGNDRACDKKCGCLWTDGIDLKFVLMELAIFKAKGVIRHEQVDDKIFRTTLVIPKVL